MTIEYDTLENFLNRYSGYGDSKVHSVRGPLESLLLDEKVLSRIHGMRMYALQRAAVDYGFLVLKNSEPYQALDAVYEHLLNKMDAEADRLAMKALVSKSPITFLNQTGGTCKVSIMESSVAQLSDMSDVLGLSFTRMALVCLILSLSTHPKLSGYGKATFSGEVAIIWKKIRNRHQDLAEEA